MLAGYYSAASGMRAALQNQDVMAHNLAHATVPGYRRQSLSFEAVTSPLNQTGQSAPARPLYGAKTAQHYSSFTSGDYQLTGNPLDLAIQGDGFFVVDGPQGPLYTRNGQFMLNASGQLVTASGLPLAGDSGALTIPANAGKISVSQDGTVSADTTQIGRIRVASFADPRQLVRAGTTLFQAPTGVAAQASTASIRQGYREGSNVQVVHEMVQMIAGMRQYEAAAKALRSLSDATQQRINGQM